MHARFFFFSVPSGHPSARGLFPILHLFSCWLFRWGLPFAAHMSGVWLPAEIPSSLVPMSALILPIFRAWAAERFQLVNTRVNSCHSYCQAGLQLPVSVSASLLFAFALRRRSVRPADGLETQSPSWWSAVLPSSLLWYPPASKASAGWWLCPKRCPLGRPPFAQELEASLVAAQCSCHGELHLEPGLA